MTVAGNFRVHSQITASRKPAKLQCHMTHVTIKSRLHMARKQAVRELHVREDEQVVRG